MPCCQQKLRLNLPTSLPCAITFSTMVLNAYHCIKEHDLFAGSFAWQYNFLSCHCQRLLCPWTHLATFHWHPVFFQLCWHHVCLIVFFWSLMPCHMCALIFIDMYSNSLQCWILKNCCINRFCRPIMMKPKRAPTQSQTPSGTPQLQPSESQPESSDVSCEISSESESQAFPTGPEQMDTDEAESNPHPG